MAKQIMIKDDTAKKLDQLRKERNCSYSVVIDNLLSDRNKTSPKKTKEFFTVVEAFGNSVKAFNVWLNDQDDDITVSETLKDETALQLYRDMIRNYLICLDLISYISEDDVKKHLEKSLDFYVYKVFLYYMLKYLDPEDYDQIFSFSKKFKNDLKPTGDKKPDLSDPDNITLSLLVD